MNVSTNNFCFANNSWTIIKLVWLFKAKARAALYTDVYSVIYIHSTSMRSLPKAFYVLTHVSIYAKLKQKKPSKQILPNK